MNITASNSLGPQDLSAGQPTGGGCTARPLPSS